MSIFLWSLCRRIFNSDVCQAAKDVDASQEALSDLFERIENFFKRLESYSEVPPTDTMTDMIVKIMVEVLNIFAVATKEMKQGRASVFLRADALMCDYRLTCVQQNISRSS